MRRGRRSDERVAVIGAGIIGISIAIFLRKAGLKPCIIDPDPEAMKTSDGNAGAFAFSAIFPLASPQILRQVPKWLLDPNGPLSVPPSYAAKIAPWLYRFWRMSSQAEFERCTRVQADLMQLAADGLGDFLDLTKTSSLLHRTGVLHIYENRGNFERSKVRWEMAREFGVSAEHFESPEALRAFEPELSGDFVAGSFTPEWWRIDDPRKYRLALLEYFYAQDGEVLEGSVTGIDVKEHDVRLVFDDGAEAHFGKVVIAAGAWSHLLARQLDEKIPLETERGYNTSFAQSDLTLRCHLAMAEHGFVVAPIGEGVRVGGAVELGGLNLPPNFGRAKNMLKIAKRALPNLPDEGGTQWMGFRPSMPDTLPVIGFAKSSPNVVYAFGHGHLGLTQSTATADIVTDLILGREPKIDIEAFRGDRFEK